MRKSTACRRACAASSSWWTAAGTGSWRAAGLMALAGSPAFAHDAHLSAADGAQAPAAAAPAVFLAAELRGANEVPPADPDGRAVEVIRIQNNTVSFAAAWRNISSPQAGH